MSDINWYVDNGTLYFYDDPINGYDITLIPPAANKSLAVNVVYGGQLSAIVYPFNQTDSNTVIASNDHLGYTGDNGYGNNIDADAGSKTAVRMYNGNNNASQANLMMFGNDGLNYHTYSNANYKYTDIGQPVTVGFNTVPDGSVESVIISTYRTPSATGSPSYVNITQKTIIRNNNLWFTTIYYINNSGTTNINGFRFYQGCDFNFNGQYSDDDDYYDVTNDTVYGHYNNGNANAIQTAGFRSTLVSSRHDVAQYGTMWQRIAADNLQNGASTNGIDGGSALAWDDGTLKAGTTWMVPVIWAVGQNNTIFSNTINYAISHNVYDVGIKSIDSPANGDSLDSVSTPIVAINATAMDVGVTDQSTTVYLQVKNSAGTVVYSASTPVSLSVPYQESAPVSFNWSMAGVTSGTYNISVYTQLSNDQNSTNDLKSITVFVRDFSLYPDQWVHAKPGDNVLFPLNLSNMGTQRTFDLSISGSTARWASNLYYNNTSILLAADTNGDGVWDWVNASYMDGSSGLPSITLPVNAKAPLLLQKLVPATADTGILDTVTLMAYPSGQPLNNSSAVLRTDTPLAATANKTFYLHNLYLNTTPESGTTGNTSVTSIFSMWSQVPAFADNFIISGNISVPIYYTTTATMPITLTLFCTDGKSSSTLIGTNTTNVTASTTAKLFNFTIVPTGGNVTVPRGSYLILKIDNQQTTTFNVLYTNTNRSRIEVKTPTYVHVGDINTYNSTAQTSSFIPGDTVKVTANVSDPIGTYDIPGATISLTAPNGSYLVNNVSMALNLTDTGSPTLWKLYNYSFILGSNLAPGIYGMNITGYESNGVISRKNISITVISPGAAISIIPNSTKVGVPGSAVDFKHTVSNLNGYQSDTVNLRYSDTLGWPVSYYKADGITPLTDTNGDGLVDTGSIGLMGSVDIIARVTIPVSAKAGNIDTITIKANSSLNRSLTANATDILSVPNAALSIVSNGTNASIPNSYATFSHTITNLNTQLSDIGEITCTGNKSWPISLYQADGVTPLTDTDSDGKVDTGLMAPSGNANIVVKILVPASASYGDMDAITVTVTSHQNSSVTTVASDLLVVYNADLDIYPDSTSLGTPNAVISFDNTIDNLNLVGPDVPDISYTSSLGWPVSLYMADGVTPLTDTDGDGTIDAGTIQANDSTDIIVKVTVPPYASPGDVNVVNITASSSIDCVRIGNGIRYRVYRHIVGHEDAVST